MSELELSEFIDEYVEQDTSAATGSRRQQFELWKKLWNYAKRYPRELRLIALCAFVTAAMDVCYPLITRAIVDEVALNGADAHLLPFAFLYLLVTVTIAAAIGGFVRTSGKLQSYISHDIRRDGFENLQRLSFSYFDHRPVGWLMARMTADCDRLSNILAWGFLDLIWGFTLMFGISATMLVLNPKLALAVLAIIPVLAWVSAAFEKHILASARTVRAVNSRITASYNEAIMGVLTSKAFVREQSNQQEFNQLTNKMKNASVRNLTQAAIYLPIVVTLASLAVGLTLAMGGVELLGGAITTGTLIAFMAYARQLFEPVEELGAWFAEMQMAQASAERILSLIEAQPEIVDSPALLAANSLERQSSSHIEETIDAIELRNVSFTYGEEKPVLDGIDLHVIRGETIAIVGATGGGKSTLVNVICRFYEPTQGDVLINGVDYRQRSLYWLQSKLGMVLQDAHVFSGSIMENIRYGRLDASDAEVIKAAKLAGAHPFIEAFDQSYATQTGEGGGQLSTGQKQLVSFARAILADPQILVMDEATSSVDTQTEQRIQSGLHELLKGRIAFVIAHRLSTVRHADRILVIDEGRIVEQGTHTELMAVGGRYSSLYQLQRLQGSTRSLSAC